MLVVTFDKIEPNRSTGYSGSLMAPYAVTPQSIAARTDREPKRMIWNIDKAKGIVWLDSPDLTPSHLELPLKPMLGCVARRTRTQGGDRGDHARARSAATWTTPDSTPA